MLPKPVKLDEKLQLFEDHWKPRVVAQMNDYQFKLAKLQGEFVWHSHEDTDETFFVLEGEMSIKFRDGKVALKKGDMLVVPQGVEHKPVSEKECSVLVIEPRGVVNTGESEGKMTAKNDVWI